VSESSERALAYAGGAGAAILLMADLYPDFERLGRHELAYAGGDPGAFAIDGFDAFDSFDGLDAGVDAGGGWGGDGGGDGGGGGNGGGG
jgi:hypothetical protein